MKAFITIAQFADMTDNGFLRVGLVVTIAVLALIVRQPRKPGARKEEK